MLKVLLYSHYFYPALGGLETVSLTLAEGFTDRGIECKVVTTTVSDDERQFPFDVIRNPTRGQQIDLVKWSDVVLFNGASLALQPWIILYQKPFVWVHVGYQVSCIDGLGWVDGNQAPISPYASFVYHRRLKGWKWALKEGLKLAIRRLVAKHIVTQNIAITDWMYNKQPLPRQIRIYNPFPINQFMDVGENNKFEYDFLYLGRIVSEKGVPTLLNAFAKVIKHGYSSSRLLMIGDGKWMEKMKALASELNITANINFVGKRSGKGLVEFVSKGKIAVIPSEWYEPMGGVALELMAAGKNLIVSEFGGLKECVGDVGLTFPNGDADALADCMIRLLKDPSLQYEQIQRGKQRVKLFAPELFIDQYIDLLKKISN